jgi:hypothetical protein
MDAGRPKDEVDAMPVEQAVWLASFHRWHLYWDDLVKWSFLPAPQRHVGLERVERRLAEFRHKHRDAILDLTEVIASVPAAMIASDRADRQLALLRIEEAIRLYAHAHAGMLPPSLEAIDDVPVPVDPTTGKAFLYRIDKGAAVVETPPGPPNGTERPLQKRRYIIHLRK